MELPVLIEPLSGTGFRARMGEPMPLTAQGATREEAILNLRNWSK